MFVIYFFLKKVIKSTKIPPYSYVYKNDREVLQSVKSGFLMFAIISKTDFQARTFLSSPKFSYKYIGGAIIKYIK